LTLAVFLFFAEFNKIISFFDIINNIAYFLLKKNLIYFKNFYKIAATF